jgi:hypothetical protein
VFQQTDVVGEEPQKRRDARGRFALRSANLCVFRSHKVTEKAPTIRWKTAKRDDMVGINHYANPQLYSPKSLAFLPRRAMAALGLRVEKCIRKASSVRAAGNRFTSAIIARRGRQSVRMTGNLFLVAVAADLPHPRSASKSRASLTMSPHRPFPARTAGNSPAAPARRSRMPLSS